MFRTRSITDKPRFVCAFKIMAGEMKKSKVASSVLLVTKTYNYTVATAIHALSQHTLRNEAGFSTHGVYLFY